MKRAKAEGRSTRARGGVDAAPKAVNERAWSQTVGGNVKGLFTISPAHDKALRDEAFRRAAAVGSRKPDASAVLREVLDEWLARRGR